MHRMTHHCPALPHNLYNAAVPSWEALRTCLSFHPPPQEGASGAGAGEGCKLMGARFDPNEAVVRNLGEFTSFAPFHEAQMRERLLAFLRNAGLEGG